MLTPEILDPFRGLLDEAKASGDREPTAMNLATVDADGRVHSRIVLLKRIDENGLGFFTNYESAKAGEMAAHDQVAVCFHWKQIREGIQVRFEGRVSKASAAESDAYFVRRQRGSQIGAGAATLRRPRGAFRKGIRRSRRAASPALGRLYPQARPCRVLVRRRVPPSRTHRARRTRYKLDEPPALSLIRSPR